MARKVWPIVAIWLFYGLSVFFFGRDGPQWALVQLLCLVNTLLVFPRRLRDRLTCAVTRPFFIFDRLIRDISRVCCLAVGLGLDTSAAFTSATGGAARRFLFTLAIRCGVKTLHRSRRGRHPRVGKPVAREEQVALPRLLQVILFGAWR